MSEVSIERLVEASQEAASQIHEILGQLTKHAEPMDTARLAMALEMPGNVYVARVEGRIVGMLQRVDVRHLVRTKCWIEDFVVDEAYRGNGIATKLLEKAIAEAPKSAASINLTSKPMREGSHRLYAKLGFRLREETTLWRLTLKEPQK